MEMDIKQAIIATEQYEAKKISEQDWAEIVTGERDVFSSEYVRRAEKIFNIFLGRLQFNHSDENDAIKVEDDVISALEQAKKELEKEKIKVATENLEYRANQRNEARAELFYEVLEMAINRLEPIKFNPVVETRNKTTEGVLCIADAHYGIEIDMKNVFGENINKYSPEILKARLAMLLKEIVNDKKKYADYGKLTVIDLGDGVNNILRMSDIAKVKTSVVDSALNYAELISQWLNELYNNLMIPIEFTCLGGNHCELRLIGGKKGDFSEENLSKIITKFIQLRLASNKNITVNPYADTYFTSIHGLNILAIHGDDAKSDESEIAFWEDYNNVDIDILLKGHLHHKEENAVGYTVNGEKEVIHIPSLMGADTFGKKCRKISKAGAKFFLVEDGIKTWEKNYCLN